MQHITCNIVLAMKVEKRERDGVAAQSLPGTVWPPGRRHGAGTVRLPVGWEGRWVVFVEKKKSGWIRFLVHIGVREPQKFRHKSL